MSDIASWLTSNGETVLAIIGGLHIIALAIVNITPTPKDNEILARVYPWIEKAAGLLTRKVKEPGN